MVISIGNGQAILFRVHDCARQQAIILTTLRVHENDVKPTRETFAWSSGLSEQISCQRDFDCVHYTINNRL